MERAIGVAGCGSHALGLGALHDCREAALAEAKYLFGRLDQYAHFVVVLAAGEPGPVRSGADLDEQDCRGR